MHVSVVFRQVLLALVLTLLASRALSVDSAPVSTGRVSGEVRATVSDRPLAGARVVCVDHETATGADGRFVITLPVGEWGCEISADQYVAQSVRISVSADQALPLRVLLVSALHLREQVEVRAPAIEPGATTTLAPSQVASAAGAAENIFRALQTLPGVAGANEFQSRLAVRGGGPDQNLTIMDGVEIHSPFRLDGVMSVFNPETVSDFELTAGAFSARYGDRLSSILVVHNRDGATTAHDKGIASLGMTDGNVVMDGKLPGKWKGTWLAAGRQTYYDLIAERVVRTNLPGFRDVQLRSTFELPQGRHLTLFALVGSEWADTVVPPKDVLPQKSPLKGGGVPVGSVPAGGIPGGNTVGGEPPTQVAIALPHLGPRPARRIDPYRPTTDIAGGPFDAPEMLALATAPPARITTPTIKRNVLENQDRFVLDSHNDVAAATFDAPLGAHLRSRTTLSYYVNDEDQTMVRRRVVSPMTAARGVGIRDGAMRSELTWDVGRHAVDVGFEGHRLSTRWSWNVGGLRPDDTWSWGSPGGPTTWGRGLPNGLQSRWRTLRSGTWAEDRMRVGTRGVVRAGLRLDHSDVNSETTLSPRFLATWQLPAGRAYVGAGRHYQSPGYEKLVQGDYFFDMSGAVRYAEALPSVSTNEPPTTGINTPTDTPPMRPSSPPSLPVAATGAQALQSARSLQLVAGFEQRVWGFANVRVEAYHKTFDRLTIGRLETEDERRARVARYDFPAELADSIPQAAEVSRFPVSNGRGTAYGVDVVIARVSQGSLRKVDGWISYGYGVARREAWGQRFPFDYDRRHAVALVASWQVRPWLGLATTTRLASGFPRTPDIRRVSAIEDANDVDGDGNRTELIPRRNGNGPVYETVDANLAQINSARYPYYARVDMRATFTPGGRQGRLLLYLDVINVLNRRVPTVQALPILPSLGARWRF